MTTFTPDADTARDFRDALGSFATGVTIVTTNSERGPIGIVANSFASLSMDPPLVLWSPAKSSRRFEIFEAADHYAIHVLSDAQREAGLSFVSDASAFHALDWTEGHAGTPLIEGSLARFECDRHAIHDGGDHAIIVGHVKSVTRAPGRPLIFAQGSYGAFHPHDE